MPYAESAIMTAYSFGVFPGTNESVTWVLIPLLSPFSFCFSLFFSLLSYLLIFFFFEIFFLRVSSPGGVGMGDWEWEPFGPGEERGSESKGCG